MKTTMTRCLATLSVFTCLLLLTDVALADRYKDESKQGGERYDRDNYGEKYEERRVGGYHHAPSVGYSNSVWSVGGTWGGPKGGIDVRVWGGSAPVPTPVTAPVYYEEGPRHFSTHHIPPGHLPPPGECRVWFYDRPAGHQPPPTGCGHAEHYAYRHGGRVIYGGPRH